MVTYGPTHGFECRENDKVPVPWNVQKRLGGELGVVYQQHP